MKMKVYEEMIEQRDLLEMEINEKKEALVNLNKDIDSASQLPEIRIELDRQRAAIPQGNVRRD